MSSTAIKKELFSGIDFIASVFIPGVNGENGKSTVLGTLSTFSYSINHQKTPVRLLGSEYPKGFVSSSITTAGSLVFATLDRHVIYEMINASGNFKGYSSKDEIGMSQLPPMDLTLTGVSDNGTVSSMSVRGMSIINEGMVLSVNDLFIENTYQYMAEKVKYLDVISEKKRNSLNGYFDEEKESIYKEDKEDKINDIYLSINNKHINLLSTTIDVILNGYVENPTLIIINNNIEVMSITKYNIEKTTVSLDFGDYTILCKDQNGVILDYIEYKSIGNKLNINYSPSCSIKNIRKNSVKVSFNTLYKDFNITCTSIYSGAVIYNKNINKQNYKDLITINGLDHGTEYRITMKLDINGMSSSINFVSKDDSTEIFKILENTAYSEFHSSSKYNVISNKILMFANDLYDEDSVMSEVEALYRVKLLIIDETINFDKKNNLLYVINFLLRSAVAITNNSTYGVPDKNIVKIYFENGIIYLYSKHPFYDSSDAKLIVRDVNWDIVSSKVVKIDCESAQSIIQFVSSGMSYDGIYYLQIVSDMMYSNILDIIIENKTYSNIKVDIKNYSVEYSEKINENKDIIDYLDRNMRLSKKDFLLLNDIGKYSFTNNKYNFFSISTEVNDKTIKFNLSYDKLGASILKYENDIKLNIFYNKTGLVETYHCLENSISFSKSSFSIGDSSIIVWASVQHDLNDIQLSRNVYFDSGMNREHYDITRSLVNRSLYYYSISRLTSSINYNSISDIIKNTYPKFDTDEEFFLELDKKLSNIYSNNLSESLIHSIRFNNYFSELFFNIDNSIYSEKEFIIVSDSLDEESVNIIIESKNNGKMFYSDNIPENMKCIIIFYDFTVSDIFYINNGTMHFANKL